MKKIGLLIASSALLTLGCISFSTKQNIVKAGATEEPAAVSAFKDLQTKAQLAVGYVQDGVEYSIKQEDSKNKVTIRFAAFIPKATKLELDALGATVEYGIKYAKGGDLSSEDATTKALTGGYVANIGDAVAADVEDANYFQFALSFNHIPSAAFDNPIAAAGYVKIDGVEYVMNERSASVNSLANEYKEGGEFSDIDEFLTWLKSYKEENALTPANNTVELDLGIIEKSTGSAAVTPAASVGGKVTYTSSDTDVATVDANGLVTAKAIGMTYITASYDGVTKVIPAVVNNSSVTGFYDIKESDNKKKEIWYAEQKQKFEYAYCYPNENLFIVKCTDDSSGGPMLRYSCKKDHCYEYTVNLTIMTNVKGAKFTYILSKGNNQSVTFTDEYGGNVSNYTWCPEDNGDYYQLKTASVGIYVINYSFTSVYSDLAFSNPSRQYEIGIGDTFNVNINKPELFSNLNIYSSDESVVTISDSGVVTGVGSGLAQIYCKRHDASIDIIHVFVKFDESSKTAFGTSTGNLFDMYATSVNNSYVDQSNSYFVKLDDGEGHYTYFVKWVNIDKNGTDWVKIRVNITKGSRYSISTIVCYDSPIPAKGANILGNGGSKNTSIGLYGETYTVKDYEAPNAYAQFKPQQPGTIYLKITISAVA